MHEGIVDCVASNAGLIGGIVTTTGVMVPQMIHQGIHTGCLLEAFPSDPAMNDADVPLFEMYIQTEVYVL